MAISWQAIKDAIESAGHEAHAASMDAHGRLVPYQDAYDFIRNAWYEAEDERADLLPATWIPNGFRQAYRAAPKNAPENASDRGTNPV